MTDEERYESLRFRAENILSILDSFGNWNGILGAGGNGALIHDRNMHHASVNSYYRHPTFKEMMDYQRQWSWNKNKSDSHVLDMFESRIKQAETWAEKKIKERT